MNDFNTELTAKEQMCYLVEAETGKLFDVLVIASGDLDGNEKAVLDTFKYKYTQQVSDGIKDLITEDDAVAYLRVHKILDMFMKTKQEELLSGIMEKINGK